LDIIINFVSSWLLHIEEITINNLCIVLLNTFALPMYYSYIFVNIFASNLLFSVQTSV